MQIRKRHPSCTLGPGSPFKVHSILAPNAPRLMKIYIAVMYLQLFHKLLRVDSPIQQPLRPSSTTLLRPAIRSYTMFIDLLTFSPGAWPAHLRELGTLPGVPCCALGRAGCLSLLKQLDTLQRCYGNAVARWVEVGHLAVTDTHGLVSEVRCTIARPSQGPPHTCTCSGLGARQVGAGERASVRARGQAHLGSQRAACACWAMESSQHNTAVANLSAS